MVEDEAQSEAKPYSSRHRPLKIGPLVKGLDVSEALFPLTIIIQDKKYLMVKNDSGKLMLNRWMETSI